MELQCTYGSLTSTTGGEYYGCSIENQVITSTDFTLIGTHEAGKTNDDVIVVKFFNCNAGKIPNGLIKIFPNLIELQVHKSNLKEIDKNDLAGYKNLEKFSFVDNKLQFLPFDLFEDFKNLKSISFFKNELKYIEPKILDGLDKLETVNFGLNSKYNICYSIHNIYCFNVRTIQDVKDKLWNVHFNDHAKLSEDLKYLFKNNNFKDFKIKVGEQEIFAHRFLLAARSSFFDNLLSDNTTNEFVEEKIPFKIVKIIFEFIYTDKMPENDVNFLHLLVGANKYDVKPLKEFANGKVQELISPESAFDVFKEAYKFSDIELMQIAFDEIKKNISKN